LEEAAMIDYLFLTLGLVPALATRMFTPMFFALAFARLGPHYEWLAHLEGVEVLRNVPMWMISDTALLTAFGLMCLELAAEKSPDLRNVVGLVDTKAKALMAFTLCVMVAGGGDAITIGANWQSGLGFPLATTGTAGGAGVLAYGWAVVIAALVWLTAWMRRAVFEFLTEIDADDDLGLARLLSWTEDLLGPFSILLVLALPMLGLLLAGAMVGTLLIARIVLAAREEGQKVPCQACGMPNHLCGVVCSRCAAPRIGIRRVGVLGGIRSEAVRDFGLHHLEMLGRRRCPACGERLEDRRMGSPCAGCRRHPFRTPQEGEAYLAWLQGRLPKTMVVLLACGAVPVLGMIPGILYYRISLIASLRCYLPAGVGFFSRWIVRVLNLFLLLLQPIPIFGMFTLPLMCWMNFVIYRSFVRTQIADELAFRPLLVPPPIPR
jgi:hypothetical protein